MMTLISNLLYMIAKASKTLAEFLTVLLLGLIAGILIVLPWLLRILALIGWLAGTFLLWKTVNDLYSAFTPALPLFAVAAVPAIVSTALIVWLFHRRQPGRLWGAMTLWGVIGWLVWRGSLLLMNWKYGSLVVHVFPAALSAILLLYINIRWGLVIRAKRLNTKGKA